MNAMNAEREKTAEDRPGNREDGETIDDAFLQMEVLYRTRCVQSPIGKNVTVREIEKKE